ncbi:hypothetical protein [Candidatus Halocynthiibacter alkanivorans]|uniref:hypothetical protein n=1 Tax=Candidatus Halocynthiibacter alkanivorans TaxID=2267619 RepID=UPI00109CE72B|nr:hypothetical protein [Candidatus Halocynthiibacter alkanivorans]
MAAIRLVKTLEVENRFATPEEQATLALYVGWGGLKITFDVKKDGATDQYGCTQAELKELLTTDEYGPLTIPCAMPTTSPRALLNRCGA